MQTVYDVDYFIKKFEAIPEKSWCVNARVEGSKRCAYGWCYGSDKDAKDSQWQGRIPTSIEERSLTNLIQTFLSKNMMAGGINNGLYPQYQQTTPKKRILAALYDIKAKQQPSQKEVIRYVAVDKEIRDNAIMSVDEKQLQ